jgi:hypothetical protein
MSFTIYVVIENGELYEHPYKTYQGAVNAVKQRWKEELDSQFEEGGMGPRGPGCCEVDVPENSKGRTYLYIEKDIHITIARMSLVDDEVPSGKCGGCISEQGCDCISGRD